MMDFRDNMHKCQEYVHGLEEEKKKIQVFQRELPLCLELVTQAIEACKQQLSGTTRTATTTTTTTECLNGHSECSEQTTSGDGPILEEFIPLKRNHNFNDVEDQHECNKPQINIITSNISNNININNNEKSGKKSDWLRSVQLWNQSPDLSTDQFQDHQPKKVAVVEVKKNGGGAFHPFQKEKSISNGHGNVNMDMDMDIDVNENKIKKNNDINDDNGNNNNNNNNNIKATSLPAVSACSSAEAAEDGARSGSGSGSAGGSKKEEKSEQSQRKSRRCWSPELHRRFLNALQQLGGSHVATPKQIRELMKVDGLTNDEVKSHLQKYRLHTRRPSSSIQNNATPQTPHQHFVVVGGIWVPPSEYAPVGTSGGITTTSPPPNGVYAPVATVASPTSLPRQQPKLSSQSRCGDRGSQSDGPDTSSSTHTTTASHAY
ncbi:hypothetical protein vseg_001669 [Gypsophila vaccaria]